EFHFREGNYETQEGLIDLSVLTEGLGVALLTQPDAVLKKRAGFELQPGDEERLRHASLRVTLPAQDAAAIPHESIPPPPAGQKLAGGDASLLYHFLGS